MRSKGRPRLDPAERSVTLNVRLPPAIYDHVYRQARDRREPMAATIRRTLTIRPQK